MKLPFRKSENKDAAPQFGGPGASQQPGYQPFPPHAQYAPQPQPAAPQQPPAGNVSDIHYRLDAPLPTQVSAPAPRVNGKNGAPEVVIARIHRHARGVILPSIAMIVGAGFLGFSTSELREAGSGISYLLIGVALTLLLGLAPLIVWLRQRFTVTSKRTTSRGSLSKGQSGEMLHHQVASVVTRQNGWQKLFGSGTIRLTGFDGRVLELNDVPNVVTVSAALRELSGAFGE
ncbi:PH domain-containing protein [Gulosibacter bifidus]|uniref:PH domain-containing protein n=1 Tax=Gulosibacter bifidus TaxID=272239 RepID=A0ABW5RIS5_9MICO|nr:PH domain-containing protein [Gulosibacter bifidus]